MNQNNNMINFTNNNQAFRIKPYNNGYPLNININNNNVNI